MLGMISPENCVRACQCRSKVNQDLFAAGRLLTCALGKDMMPLIQRIKEAFGAESFALRKFDREAEVGTKLIRIAV